MLADSVIENIAEAKLDIREGTLRKNGGVVPDSFSVTYTGRDQSGAVTAGRGIGSYSSSVMWTFLHDVEVGVNLVKRQGHDHE